MPNPLHPQLQLPGAFNFFQIGYVTNDVERATSEFAVVNGIREFQINRDVQLETANGIIRGHFALAFAGDTQIEVIQPLGGPDELYRNALTPGEYCTRMHHFAHLFTRESEWNSFLAGLSAAGIEPPVRARFPIEGPPLMHFLYVDARRSFGHYLEFMYQTDAGRDMFAAVPRF